MPRILVVAATEHELAPGGDWARVVCGVGPVEAAVGAAVAIAEHRPLVVLHVGIAGARRAAGLPPPAIVIGSESRYCDLAAANTWAPGILKPSARFIEAARRALPQAHVSTIGTSARVGGTTGCDVEAMEGFAVLRAAERAGVPAIEVRVISNEIEEEDRSKWRFADAFRTVAWLTPLVVGELDLCVN